MKTIVSLVLIIMVAGSAFSAPAIIARPSSVRITTLKGPTGLGMLELIEAGSLKLPDGSSVPLEIEIAGGPEVLDARILGKQADLVTIPVNQAARLYTKGAGVQLAAVNVWGVLYVLSTNPAVKSWADLKGRPILASGKGSTTDVSFRELAQKSGLSPDSDLVMDYSLGHVEVMQMAAGGKADLVLLPEPFVSMALLKNPALKVVIDLQKEWSKVFGALEQAQGGLAVSSEFARQYPEVTKAVLSAYKKSCEQVLLAPDAPARIAKQDFGLTEAAAKESLPRINLRYLSAEDAKTATQAYLAILFKANPASVGGKMPDNGFYLTVSR